MIFLITLQHIFTFNPEAITIIIVKLRNKTKNIYKQIQIFAGGKVIFFYLHYLFLYSIFIIKLLLYTPNYNNIN
jgi:hypothetical protein